MIVILLPADSHSRSTPWPHPLQKCGRAQVLQGRSDGPHPNSTPCLWLLLNVDLPLTPHLRSSARWQKRHSTSSSASLRRTAPSPTVSLSIVVIVEGPASPRAGIWRPTLFAVTVRKAYLKKAREVSPPSWSCTDLASSADRVFGGIRRTPTRRERGQSRRSIR